MASLIALKELAEAITTKWHLSRARTKASDLIKNEVTRYNSKKRRRYLKGKIFVYVDSSNQIRAYTTDKIANIIEHGFKAYNWGMRVLNNAANKVFGAAPNRYMRIMIKDKLLNKKVIRTVSERAIMENPNKWMMPDRAGERYLKNAITVKRTEIRKIFKEAAEKDIINTIRKSFFKR